MGQPIYVEVDANAVNSGIMTMDASGIIEGGSLWITWDQTGFESVPWSEYWTETPLRTWWATVYTGHPSDPVVTGGNNYTNDVTGFTQWMSTEPPANLNAALGNWSDDEKLEFLKKHTNDIFIGCTVSR